MKDDPQSLGLVCELNVGPIIRLSTFTMYPNTRANRSGQSKQVESLIDHVWP